MRIDILDFLPIIVCIVVVGIVAFLCNASSDWNDGECPQCHEKYELVGVSRYTKYYVCDNCGKEVKRW